MLQPHLKGGVESGDYVRIGPILGGISPTFSPTHKFEFISMWYKWRLIKQSNVNHYLAPCGKIEYLLDCIPCGWSPPWPRPYHGPFFLVLFIVCRRTSWTTFLAHVSGQAREQSELLWPKRNSSVTQPSTQCSATDTKLDNNWKCQQGLICPYLTGLFKYLTVHACKPRSVSEQSSICASDWLTSRYPHLWLVSLLSAQVSVCPLVWAWCLNAKWISLEIVSRGWQQKSSLKMDTNISIQTLSWTYDTRESNLNTAGIRTLGPYKHHDIGY